MGSGRPKEIQPGRFFLFISVSGSRVPLDLNPVSFILGGTGVTFLIESSEDKGLTVGLGWGVWLWVTLAKGCGSDKKRLMS